MTLRKRSTIFVGAAAAIYVFVLLLIAPVPGTVVALFGGARDGVARYGGLELRWKPPAGVDLTSLAATFERRDIAARLRRDGDAVLVEVAGIPDAQARELAASLVAPGLEFHEVIKATAIADLVRWGIASNPDERRRGGWGDERAEPTFEVDQWRLEDGGPMQTDYYLAAHSREVLAAAFAEAERRGWAPPAGTMIVFERMDPSRGSQGWRSYLVASEVALEGSSVANAVGAADPYTNRPIVLLDFDREGAKKFGDLTARIAGKKLATMLGGVVRSAPIINGPIRGGRASITMGGTDPEAREHERDLLVATLRAGTLPVGGQVLDTRFVPPPAGTAEWLGRLALALVSGIAAAMLAWFLVGYARPEQRAVAVLPGAGSAVKPILWTIGAIMLLVFGTTITLPGVNDVELAHILYKSGISEWTDTSQFSVFALGISPLLTTFVVVEMVASIVPRWRPLRDTALGRRRLGRVVAIGAVLVAGIHGHFAVLYLEALNRGGIDVVARGAHWPIVATLIAGTMCLAWLASVIANRGVGNGYAVLFLALLVVRQDWSILGTLSPDRVALVVVVPLSIVAIVIAMVSWRVCAPGGGSIPLPSAGITPVNEAGGLLATIGALGILGVAPALGVWMQSLAASVWIGVPLVLVMTVLWSWVFTRPGRRGLQLDRDTWRRATTLSAGMLLAIFALGRSVLAEAPGLSRVLDPVTLVVLIAIVLDVVDDVRTRRRALVPVWPLHDPLLVDAVRDRLDAVAIPHSISSTRLRRLLWLFGSFAPMYVMVPAEHAEAAETLLGAWLAPATAT